MKVPDRKAFEWEFFHSFIRPLSWNSFELPVFQAHRGARHPQTQENTLRAFQKAADSGFHMSEVDVQLAADGVPVAWHDLDLQRICQRPERVKGLSSRELQEMAGASTLEELLRNEGCPKFWNIELKTAEILNESLERRVVEVIRRAGAQERVLLSSFNPFSVWKASRFAPEIPRAWIVTGEEHPRNHWTLQKLVYAPLIPMHLLHLDERDCTPEFLNQAKDHGLKVAVWTVNEEARIRELFDQGVVSVITDRADAPQFSKLF
jgi:glycerophosphoryl diester phosphodiesterase